MSVAAVMLVRDEADIIEYTIRHLLGHVDQVIVADNLSADGTREILEGLPVEIVNDNDPGYWQSRKTTELAMKALEGGHQWVVPCDADEVWYVGGEVARPLRDYLCGVGPDTQIVKADLFNHIPTSKDPESDNPLVRIGWRKREHSPLPKVCCRLHPSLVIHAGNHGASYQGVGMAATGLVIRHFSWRSPEQYLHKIRVGEAAYAHTDLPETTGQHWRMFTESADDVVLEHFRRWFYSRQPQRDDTLIYDPAPLLA